MQKALHKSILTLNIIRKSHFGSATASTSVHCEPTYDFSNKVLENEENLAKIDSSFESFIYEMNEETIKVKQKKNLIFSARHKLQKELSKNGVCLVPIGSASNHLLSSKSDLDLVLLPSKIEKEWKEFNVKFNTNFEFRMMYMNQIADQIRKSKIKANRFQILTKSRTPIIKFFLRNLAIDIQFGNVAPIQSTLFVRTCVEYDERVKPIIMWMTHQFQKAGILNSRMSLFSRYHVNTLTIHFLQAMPYPVLPDVIKICPWLRKDNDWNNAVNVLGKQGSLYVPCTQHFSNESSVAVIILQLIDYFSQIDFSNVAIDTKGNLLKRKSGNSLELIDEYFDEPTCRVPMGASLLSQLFDHLKLLIENREFEKVFKP